MTFNLSQHCALWDCRLHTNEFRCHFSNEALALLEELVRFHLRLSCGSKFWESNDLLRSTKGIFERIKQNNGSPIGTTSHVPKWVILECWLCLFSCNSAKRKCPRRSVCVTCSFVRSLQIDKPSCCTIEFLLLWFSSWSRARRCNEVRSWCFHKLKLLSSERFLSAAELGFLWFS